MSNRQPYFFPNWFNNAFHPQSARISFKWLKERPSIQFSSGADVAMATWYHVFIKKTEFNIF